jgi:uncharacterized membrane protein SpoIIM required for sporulation
MKVVELLERRRQNWQELERYCERISLASLNTAEISRFSALYRAACADLALSNSYQLPENTVQYLHKLVGRAHNQLYRAKRFDLKAWGKMLLEDVPQRIFNDRCVQTMFVFFWGFFILSAWLSYSKTAWPEFADEMIPKQMMEQMNANFKEPIDGRDGDTNLQMAAFYIRNNTGIGLQCFVWGLLVIPGLYITAKNAVWLGAAFGYMARPDVPQGENFFHFVRAHGPFELTAIVLSAGAGLRLGLAWIMPGQLSRGASLQKNGAEMMPVMCAAMLMFFFAAIIEGFLSPSAAPLWVKSGVALISSALLAFYFVVLGFPRRLLNAAR